jgi:nitroimidazol reductase NimA-like FMN-containing flavoprotein (pyridoxamine 5'-phosphate oxidase superfamily)
MTTPRADRPHVPGYGIPTSTDGILDWSWARERLDRAITYWLATTGADAAPHMIPIWGAWVDDRWYVEGGPTRWQRNLRVNPQLAVKVEFGKEVVIVEGPAREIVAPEPGLASRILAGYAKYKQAEGYTADEANWAEGGLWELRPVKAFAWSIFPDDMTRFRFEVDDPG